MSRDSYRGPKLPQFLLDQVQNGNGFKRGPSNIPRKDRRKAERQEKKAVRSKPKNVISRSSGRQNGPPKDQDSSSEGERIRVVPLAPKTKPKTAVELEKPLKSILKKSKAEPLPGSESDSDSVEEATVPSVSRAVKAKLADDDAEIASLEKKLGIKGKKSKALESDGLDWLVDGSDSGSNDDSAVGSKRKRPDDAKWLQDKRLKASSRKVPRDDEQESGPSDASESDLLEQDDSERSEGESENSVSQELDSEGFEEFESDVEGPPSEPKRQRENPYVPPVSKSEASSAKYIPPSLRKPAASDEEASRQLHRQIQGLLNRLSEANMLSILKSLEELYARHPRQHVTSVLVDLLIGLIADPVTLNDTFLILHAGFTAGVFKVFGPDFGALVLEKLVEALDHYRNNTVTRGKQSLNLLAFLSSLYNFQVVGSGLVFDYIRLLLDELSENNTELLLRVIRTSGHQLRLDDPSSLKDIVVLLQRSVLHTGEEQLSVRTKFMIETINDLKNNRMKAGAAGSAIAAEHTSRMKRTLGSMNNSLSLRSTEPLRITLSDIRDSDKKGKWWLVGASYLNPAKHAANGDAGKVSASTAIHAEDGGYESETPGSVNLHKLARTQGMNTDVRRAIFITILSSSDHEEAHERLLKLHLKSKQMLEIPRVLVHCAGAEQAYNPFYAVLAQKFCGEHKIRKAFQFTLWDLIQQMDAETDGIEEMSMRKLVNLAKLYGHLVANGGLDIKILKKLEFAYLQDQISMFAEVLLTTVFLQAANARKTNFEKTIKDVFARSAGVPNLPQGLQIFLDNVVKNTELASRKRERKAIEKGSVLAIEALTEAAKAAPDADDDEEDSDN